jgi:glucan 1,3-beta-glucosidase
VPQPPISRIIGPEVGRTGDKVAIAVGLVATLTLLVAIITALGLVFDPRYRDFPFAPLTAAAVPFFVASLVTQRPAGGARQVAETVGALMLLASVVYIVPNETLRNWQSLWLCAALVLFAISLVRVRDAQS